MMPCAPDRNWVFDGRRVTARSAYPSANQMARLPTCVGNESGTLSETSSPHWEPGGYTEEDG